MGSLSNSRYKRGTNAFGARGTFHNAIHIKPHTKVVPSGINGEVKVKNAADPDKVEAYRLQKIEDLKNKYKRKQ